MNYLEAKKLIQSTKNKDNFILIKLDYSKILILPYKDGITFISSLLNAERLSNRHSSTPQIDGFDTDSISIEIMSNVDYERIKIASLLRISVNDVIEAEEQNAKLKTP